MTLYLSLTDLDVAWLAGLFEGEAFFGLDERAKKKHVIKIQPHLLCPILKSL